MFSQVPTTTAVPAPVKKGGGGGISSVLGYVSPIVPMTIATVAGIWIYNRFLAKKG